LPFYPRAFSALSSPRSAAARRGAHGGSAHSNAAAVHLAAGPTAALGRNLGNAAQIAAQRAGLVPATTGDGNCGDGGSLRTTIFAMVRAVALGVAVETANRCLKQR